MTNMEALKAIFVALGGSEGDTASFKKLSDALEGISENVSGGGGGGGGVTGLKVFNLETTTSQHGDVVLDFGMTWAQLLDLMEHNIILVSYVDELSHSPDTAIYADVLGMYTYEGSTHFMLTIAGVSTSVSEANMSDPAYMRVE